MARRNGRWRPGLGLLLVMAIGLMGVAAPSVAQQGQPIPSAQGHAQIIAQGVTSLPAGEAAWRVVYHTIEPDAAPSALAPDLHFLLVDQGTLLLETAAGEPRALLGQGEATFLDPGSDPEQRAVALDGRPAGYYAIDVAPPAVVDETGDGFAIYAGTPFASLPGERDLKLIRDILVPEESATVAAVEPDAPILVLATLGTITVDAGDGGEPVELRVGQAAELSGEVTVRGEGLAPATFVAAVIGREVPDAAAGTPAASPTAGEAGTVAVRLHACPDGLRPGTANLDACLPDFNAVDLTLVEMLDDGAERELGAPSAGERDLRWLNLPVGDYVMRATGFGSGLDRFFVAGLAGTTDTGAAGFSAGEDGGYLIPITASDTSYQLDVYAFAAGAESPPGTPAVPATREAAPQDAGGSVAVRVFACPTVGLLSFDPLACALAPAPFDVSLASPELPAPLTLANATPTADGYLRWDGLGPGAYTLQVPLMPAGTVAYFVVESPVVTLLPDGTGYAVTLAAGAADQVIDLYTVGPEPVPPTAMPTLGPTAVPIVFPTPDPATLDTDGDSLTDEVETTVHGTDPTVWDTDGDGVSDGAEIQAGTDPFTPNTAPAAPAATDSDSDGLPDADEIAIGTDPANPDTDGDGWLDGNETMLGTDPFDPASFPVSP